MDDGACAEAATLPRGNFAERLAAALTLRGLGLQRVSERLREEGISCSPSTLSLWSNGRTMPRRAEAKRAVVALERVLRVPEGYLVEATGEDAVRPDNWFQHSANLDGAESYSSVFARAREDLDYTSESSRAERRMVHETVWRDEHRAMRGIRARQLIRATGGGIERVLVATAVPRYALDRPGVEMRNIRVLVGGRLGRLREFPAVGVTVAEVLFDRPLRDGEETLLEFLSEPGGEHEPASPGMNHHDVTCLVPVQHMYLEVVFHPEATPVWIRGAVNRRLGGSRPARTVYRDVDLLGSVAMESGKNLISGGVRLEWAWDEV